MLLVVYQFIMDSTWMYWGQVACAHSSVYVFIFLSFHFAVICLLRYWWNQATVQSLKALVSLEIWAASWQNQQSRYAPSEDSDQPGHRPSLISVFTVRMKKPWVISYTLRAQQRLWSDWADAQADPSLHWAHPHFVGFVMLWLIYFVLWL